MSGLLPARTVDYVKGTYARGLCLVLEPLRDKSWKSFE